MQAGHKEEISKRMRENFALSFSFFKTKLT
jgi:hypothetical protein